MQKREGMGGKEKAMGTLKIYILHGWTYDTVKWDEFVSLLKRKYDVELLKIPGLTAKLEKPFTVNDYVSWLKKEIGKEKVVLIGHSNGGRIAVAFASQYPDAVSSIILIDSAGIYHSDFKITVKRFVFKTIAKAGKKLSKSKRLKSLLYKVAREKDYKEAPPIVKKTMENLITYDVSPLLPSIRSKALIVWGENDKITPLSDGKCMHALIPDSSLEIISGARHSPQFTHPKRVVEIISSFLS